MDNTIEVPVQCRSVYGEMPGENMTGIQVTRSQLSQFAKLMNRKHDEIIPLDKDKQVHPDYCPENHEIMENCVFWHETDGSGHGWCCSVCGQVTQWG